MAQNDVFYIFSKFLSEINLKWHHFTTDISAQTPYLEKFCVLNYGPKCSWPFKLHDPSNLYELANCAVKTIFLGAGKHQSFLQVDINILCEHSQACPDNQSNCKIRIRAISQKGCDVLPWFFIT